MSNHNQNITTPQDVDANETNSSFLENIDFNKIREIIFKSLIWVILINTLTITLAYFYLKYQKPLYQSNSLLKLTVENEKVVSNLSLISPEENLSNSGIVEEIEMTRSEIVLGAVADTAQKLKVSYFAKGNFTDKEMYGYSPFKVIYTKKSNHNLYDKKIELSILDKQKFTLSFKDTKKTYQFGKKIKIQGETIEVIKNTNFSSRFIGVDYYFIIHSRNSLIEYLKKNLIVGQQNKDAKTFSIGFKEYELLKARDIVGLIDSIYLEKTKDAKNISNKQTLEFLEKQIKEYKDSVDKYASILQNYFLENKTRDINSKVEEAIDKLEELNKERSVLSKQLAMLTELQVVIEDDKKVIEDEFIFYQIEDPNIKEAFTKLREKSLEKKRLEARVKPGNTTTKSRVLNIEKNQIQKDLRNIITAVKQGLRQGIEEFNTQINEAQSVLQNLPRKEDDYADIEQQYQIYKDLYSKFSEQRINIMIAQAGVIPKSIILSPATLPKESIGTPAFIIYGIAILLGVFLSIGLVFLRYSLHDKIMNPKELERYLKAPILGVIPMYRKHKMEHSELVVDKNPKSSLNEAIRDIRTNLEFMLPNDKGLYNKDKPPLLSVTSTISGEGKTFVVSNLAGLIAMVNTKVIILDFDMRKPKLHLAFGAENEKGVSTILIGKTSIEECIQQTKIKNLHFISSGPTPPNPSELILREDFNILLDELKKLYDVVMIDTPPVGLVTDAMLIMKKVDLPIYITKANYSKKGFTKNINRLYLKDFNNLSVVLNAVKANSNSYSHGGGYYSRYGYGYYTDDQPTKSNVIQKLRSIFRFKKRIKHKRIKRK